MTSFFSLSLTLFFIMDALGVVPIYLTLVKKLPRKRQLFVAVRELLIALLVMVIFHYFGQFLLTLLGVTKTTVQISGGLILFLIAIRLIFPTGEEEEIKPASEEPFVVPIAIPLIAGPTVLAAIMIYAQEQPSDLFVLGAIFVAWLASAVVILLARPLQALIKDRGLFACKRLMGLILALIAVQMFLHGIQGCIPQGINGTI